MRKRPPESNRSIAVWVACFTLAASSAVVRAHDAAQFGGSPLSRVSRAEQPLREYRAYRRMHAFSESLKHEAWMEAWTELKDFHCAQCQITNLNLARFAKLRSLDLSFNPFSDKGMEGLAGMSGLRRLIRMCRAWCRRWRGRILFHVKLRAKNHCSHEQEDQHEALLRAWF